MASGGSRGRNVILGVLVFCREDVQVIRFSREHRMLLLSGMLLRGCARLFGCVGTCI